MRFLTKSRVELGEGYILAYTLFEWKKLFSIIIYHWKTIEQNRFHSHAFPAIAFLLRGAYDEEVFTGAGIIRKRVNQILKPRFLPINYTHRILKAEPKTWTIVFVGPWVKYWYEYFEQSGTWIKYTWGRKVVNKLFDTPIEILKANKNE